MSPAPVPRATDATYIATPASTPIDTTRLHRTLTDIVCHSSISELLLGHRTILLTNQLLKRYSLTRSVDGASAFLGWCSGYVTSVGKAGAQVRIGTSGWSYDHWAGVLYRPGLPVAKRLARYVEEFDTVELNAS